MINSNMELYIDLECESCEAVWGASLVNLLDHNCKISYKPCIECGSDKTKMIEDSLHIYTGIDCVYIQRENGNAFGEIIALENVVEKLVRGS